MANITHETRFDLDANEFVALEETKAAILRCESGELWVTQDRDDHDFILRPGKSMEIDAHRQVFVCAFGPSTAIIRQQGRCAPAAHMTNRLYATLTNWATPKLFRIPATMLR